MKFGDRLIKKASANRIYVSIKVRKTILYMSHADSGFFKWSRIAGQRINPTIV